MIYLDNAATTRTKPPAVAQAMLEALSSYGNCGRGGHEGALSAARTIYGTREKIAALLGCPRADHAVFTANSTQALNIAISGLLGPGDHILSTDLEHNSVLRPLYRLREAGAAVDFVPAGGDGRLDYGAFEALLRPETKAVVCTHASNLTGDVVDIGRVGRFAKEHGLLFILDASQTAGVFPIDVQEMNIDILCFTGHKSLLGPQGTGGMYVREGVDVRPLLSGGSGVQTYSREHPAQMPTALEAGTLNGHGIAGLNAAVSYIQETGLDVIRNREQALMRRFYDSVKEIPGVKIYGDFTTDCRCPIVALNLGDYDSSEVSDELFMSYGIATRPGAHCAPLMHQALGTVEQGAVRFSFSHYNTEEEIDAAAAALRELA